MGLWFTDPSQSPWLLGTHPRTSYFLHHRVGEDITAKWQGLESNESRIFLQLQGQELDFRSGTSMFDKLLAKKKNRPCFVPCMKSLVDENII